MDGLPAIVMNEIELDRLAGPFYFQTEVAL